MDPTAPADLLRTWIARQASVTAMDWLDRTAAALANDPTPRALGLAISIVPRHTGKADLALSPVDLAAAGAVRPGWTPSDWSADQAARVLLLLAAMRNGAPFAPRLRALVTTSDVGELAAIYRGLPLYPEPAAYVDLAIEGLRTAVRSVFEAVAHRNPFPAEQFGESAWNHMVLKALFIETSLDPIQGLDRRWNADLARTLCDYAHERWAAGRPVSPELWRGVGRFADMAALDDLDRVIRTGSARDRAAATLALGDCALPEAAALLKTVPDLETERRAGRIAWALVAVPDAPAVN